jgi:hypothetical protein
MLTRETRSAVAKRTRARRVGIRHQRTQPRSAGTDELELRLIAAGERIEPDLRDSIAQESTGVRWRISVVNPVAQYVTQLVTEVTTHKCGPM